MTALLCSAFWTTMLGRTGLQGHSCELLEGHRGSHRCGCGAIERTSVPTVTLPADHHPARQFVLYRHVDHSGVSGTGIVAEGIEWTTGRVAVHWPEPHPATSVWDSIEHLLAVHGHGGSTEVVWVE